MKTRAFLNVDLISQLKLFGLKVTIFFFCLIVFMGLAIPDVDDIQYLTLKVLHNERSKLILLGLVQNPVALKKLSEIDESAGKLDMAVLDMEMAIGLLSSHGADAKLIDAYTDRLQSLSQRSNIK